MHVSCPKHRLTDDFLLYNDTYACSYSCFQNLPNVVEPQAVQSFTPDEESSSSFYSFLKTDTGSGSNDDSNSVDTRNKSTASNVCIFISELLAKAFLSFGV